MLGAEGFEDAARFLDLYWRALKQCNLLPGEHTSLFKLNTVQILWFQLQILLDTCRNKYDELINHSEIVATAGFGAGAKLAEQRISQFRAKIVSIFGEGFFSTVKGREVRYQEMAHELSVSVMLWDEIGTILYSRVWDNCTKEQQRVICHVEIKAGKDPARALALAEEVKLLLSENPAPLKAEQEALEQTPIVRTFNSIRTIPMNEATQEQIDQVAQMKATGEVSRYYEVLERLAKLREYQELVPAHGEMYLVLMQDPTAKKVTL